MTNDLETRVRLARSCTWFSYGLLILSLLFGGLFSGTPLTLLIIGIAPLLLFAPGMLKLNHRSLAMLCFVTLLYFIVIVVNLTEPDKSVFDIIAVVAVSSLFISAMMLSRWIQYFRLEQRSGALAGGKESQQE